MTLNNCGLADYSRHKNCA